MKEDSYVNRINYKNKVSEATRKNCMKVDLDTIRKNPKNKDTDAFQENANATSIIFKNKVSKVILKNSTKEDSDSIRKN